MAMCASILLTYGWLVVFRSLKTFPTDLFVSFQFEFFEMRFGILLEKLDKINSGPGK